jgi:hypothetical protein
MVEGPKLEEPELASESKRRREILEGKHWEISMLIHTYKARIPSFGCLKSHQQFTFYPVPA